MIRLNYLRKNFFQFVIVILATASVLAAMCAAPLLAGCQQNQSGQDDTTFKATSLTCLTDIHLHLDGAISVSSAQQLGKAQGIPVSDDYDTVRQQLRVDPDCNDLNEFLEKFSFPNSLLQTQEGVYMAVRNLLKEEAEQAIMYCEIRFAPQKSCENGLTQEQVVEAAIKGLQTSNIKSNLTLCCMRGDNTHEANMKTIEVAKKYLGQGVVAVDLAGAEAMFPTSDYKAEFDKAKELGVPYTIHAGEADGPESVKSALSFGTKRIGHGVRAIEDDELVQKLADEQIILEMCPTSNIKTCVYGDMSEHPIKKFIDAGCKVTINTDDPSVEGTLICLEYQKVIDQFKLGRDDVKAIISNSIDAAFCDDATKAELRQRLENEFAKF